MKMGHASAAMERRASYAQQMAGEEPHAVTPRGQMNEAIREARGLGVYIERGREWLHEVGDRLRERAEVAAHTMADLAREAAQMMRAKLQRGPEDGFEALPALDQSPRREHTPAIEMDRSVQIERDRQRQQERQRGLDGPEMDFGR